MLSLKTLHPPNEQLANDLLAIRRRLLRGMLITLAVLGGPALFIAGLEAFRFGQLTGVSLYTLLYVLVTGTALLFHRLPFGFCAGVMLGSLYLVAGFNLLHFAFAGAGIELYLTISVLSTVLLGLRSGLTVGAVCLVSLLGIGLCFVSGLVPLRPEMSANTVLLVSWATAGFVFSLLAGTLVFSIGWLQEHLIRTVQTVRRQSLELAQTNEELSREIGQRKAAETQLQQSEAQFKTLFEMAPDAFYLQDREGIFLDANQAAETLLDVSREAFIGKQFQGLNILPPPELSKALKFLERNSRGESTGPDQLTLLTANGRPVLVEIRTCPFQLGEKQVVLGIARDISERKRLESQLHQSQKMEALGTLAGGIAHDFNNILSAVIGYTDLALSQAVKGSFMHDNLSEVLAAGNRAKDLVGQILAISRHEEQLIQPLQINPLVKEALKMLRSTLPTSIEFKERIAKQPLVVQANPTQMHQVIMNLATNAMQAMAEHEGILEVCLEEVDFDEEVKNRHLELGPGRYARLIVSDTGKGMSESMFEKIFEPYFTTKERGTGTGLGLSVVHGIIKSHEGHVTVYSEPGRGSTFHVYLPLADKTFIDAPEKDVAPLPGGSEHILFVDDEPSITKVQELSLGRLGYLVTPRTDSLEALETFRSSPETFDLLITDMTMPKMTGDKLAAAVKELRPDLPVILCTGFSEKVNGQGENRNIDGFLMKPADKTELAKTIRRVLDRSQSAVLSGGPEGPADGVKVQM